jgi:serine/threonine protein kinase
MSSQENHLRTFVDIDASEHAHPSTTKSAFDFVGLAKLLLYRNVDIIAYSELQPASNASDAPDPHLSPLATPRTVLGRTEHRTWNGKVVAVKLPPTMLIESSPDNAIPPHAYSKFMADVSFGIQVMTYKPLCDHPNIVKLLGLSFQEPVVSNLIVPTPVLEATTHKYPNLKSFIENQRQPVPLQRVFELISDIADGITVLHDFGIVHGCIMPENILLFDDSKPGRVLAKLGNFGPGGAQADDDRHAERWLPPDYRLCSTEADRRSLDIYAFGRVGVYLCTQGDMPVGPGAIDLSLLQMMMTTKHVKVTDSSDTPNVTQNISKLIKLLSNALETDRLKKPTRISQTRHILLGTY